MPSTIAALIPEYAQRQSDGPAIGESLLTVRTADAQLLVSVSDSGIGLGLPVGEVDRIFDAFFTTKAQGIGMGLSISRRIIESHGGRLWACVNRERGATF